MKSQNHLLDWYFVVCQFYWFIDTARRPHLTQRAGTHVVESWTPGKAYLPTHWIMDGMGWKHHLPIYQCRVRKSPSLAHPDRLQTVEMANQNLA